VETEIRDYLDDNTSGIYFAHSNEEAIRVLDERIITSIILNLRVLNDAVILRYVNVYYPDVHIIVSAAQEFDEMITIFSKARFARLQAPLRLEQLKTMLRAVGPEGAVKCREEVKEKRPAGIGPDH